jgi:hypothetical protein
MPHAPDSEGDRLRQLLHELRTPVNAIQGFAEIIQQQLFGPAPHEYRALAAVIAADSARMLAGFEELDRYAKLDSGAIDLDSGECDLASSLAGAVARLQPTAQQAGPRLALTGPDCGFPVALAAVEAERLCWRLLSTLIGNAAPEEVLTVSIAAQAGDGQAGGVQIRLSLPQALAGLDDAALYHAAALPAGQVLGMGMFGTGFSLRLAGAEARGAGGRLHREGGLLMLALPGLTQTASDPSKVGQSHPDRFGGPAA